MSPVFPPHQTPTAFALPQGDPRDEAALVLLGHDLRAALADVLGGLRLIDPSDLPAAAQQQFGRVRASAEVLARLLEQGVSNMLGAPDQAAPQDTALDRLLTDIDLRWSGRAAEKGLGFAVVPGAGLPSRLRIDQVALERVLSNLIGNAIMYCDQGDVACHAVRGPDGGVCFSIRDDGPGYPPIVLTGGLPLHHRPSGMTKPGSGMGLHIARALTERLGGRLTLRNPAAGGAEALLCLPPPAGMASRADAPPDSTTAPADRLLAGKRVLVADDNPTSQALLASFATALGAEVVVARDGAEALARLDSEGFALLVVDIEMPRLSGLQVIRALRAMPPPWSRLPVIAVTACALRDNRDAIMAAGANATLSKPLLCQHLFDAGLHAAFALAGAPPDVPPLPTGDTRLARLLDMAGPEVASDLLARLIEDLSQVRRGLEQAATGPDWRALRDHAHVLISLAGTVGADPLHRQAEALNALAQQAHPADPGLMLAAVLALLDPLIGHVIRIRDAWQPVP